MAIYDDTKLAAAVDQWAKGSLEMGFGVEYSKALLADFDKFIEVNKLMSGSPGPVALGKQLKRIGLVPVRRKGLRYWEGAKLKRPIKVEPKRNRATFIHDQQAQIARDARKQGKTPLQLAKDEAERDAAEARERIREAVKNA